MNQSLVFYCDQNLGSCAGFVVGSQIIAHCLVRVYRSVSIRGFRHSRKQIEALISTLEPCSCLRFLPQRLYSRHILHPFVE